MVPGDQVRGVSPRAKISIMIMRPPQHRQRGASAEASSSLLASPGSPRSSGCADQGAQPGDVGSAHGAGEQPIVADAVEAVGQDVKKKAPDELARRQGHGLDEGLAGSLASGAIVLPAEGDAVVVEADEPVV